MYSANANIQVEPKDIWEYFNENRNELLTDMVSVAENGDFDVIIYLTSDDDKPCLIVESSNCETKEFNIKDEESCEVIAAEVYNIYLTDRIIEVITIEDIESEAVEMDTDDIISERESDLDCFVLRFLEDVLGEDPVLYSDKIDDIVEDCKERFLEHLYRKHKLSIYRPMELEDDEGVFFEEYPYECMEFETNPLYDKEK